MTIHFGDGTSISGAEGSNMTASAGVTQQIIRKYTSNATYTPASNVKYIQVHCIGGGGGGSSGTRLQGDENTDSRGFGGAGSGAYSIGTYTMTGTNFSGSIVVGGGGEGGQQNDNQFRAGSDGGDSKFQPSGSYSGTEGQLIGERGEGCAAGTQFTGEGGETQGGTQFVSFAGEDGEARQGSGGEHLESYPGRGGHTPLAGTRTYGAGANGGSGAEEFDGANGEAGVVFIYEFRA